MRRRPKVKAWGKDGQIEISAKTLSEWTTLYPKRELRIHNTDDTITQMFSDKVLNYALFGPAVDPEREDMKQEALVSFDYSWIPVGKLTPKELVWLSQNCDSAVIERVAGVRYLKLWWD